MSLSKPKTKSFFLFLNSERSTWFSHPLNVLSVNSHIQASGCSIWLFYIYLSIYFHLKMAVRCRTSLYAFLKLHLCVVLFIRQNSLLDPSLSKKKHGFLHRGGCVTVDVRPSVCRLVVRNITQSFEQILMGQVADEILVMFPSNCVRTLTS